MGALCPPILRRDFSIELELKQNRDRQQAALFDCLLLDARGAGTSGPPGISIEERRLPVVTFLEWASLGATADGAVIHNHVLVLWAVW